MPPKKKGPTKPKARRVPSDDCILTIDGEEYAIHAGEWVEFRGRPKMGFFTRYLRFQGLGESAQAGTLTDEDTKELARVAEDIGDELAKSISAWSWTGDDGEPMPLPTVGEALNDLEQDEFQWLLYAYFEPMGGGRKNASSPSTSA